MLKLKDDIIFSLEGIGAGQYYNPIIEVYKDIFSNLKSNVKDALQKLEN